MKYEHKSQRVAPRRVFLERLAGQVCATIVLTVVSLGIGMWGYCYFENMSTIDSFLNAAMILGGMGEIGPLETDAGKIFAGFYALYGGFFMVACGGLLLVPVFHRTLHHFHVEK